jgi:hypothetical protein
MTNLVVPRTSADMNDHSSSDVLQDGELTMLIRRWMAAGGRVQDRVRRDTHLRVAPAAPGDREARVDVAPREAGAPTTVPPLPRRSTGDETEQVHRVALLIDARRVSADVASALLARLGERGAVNVCRAYADWNRSDLADWVSQMRKEGLHSFHHYSEDDDQALVAMTIDAVDIARDAAVDEVVIAGDLTSALPLVHRLHAAGVRVVAVGQGHTPHDVRAACHEFIDTATIDGTPAVPQGRHRA